ncbi:MAG TPA: hypothetical protein VIV60_21765 [Polyangiaceae bacterium]
MSELNDPELEHLRSELLALGANSSLGSAGWSSVLTIVAATRAHLARNYPHELANCDVVTREPSWSATASSSRRPIMGILEGLDEDRRIEGLRMQNLQKFEAAVGAIVTTVESIDKYACQKRNNEVVIQEGLVDRIRRIIDRFQQVGDALRSHRTGRHGVKLDDEYDVQFLLGGLLRVYFDDVETESWTPSYAGGSARMDFLLPQEQTAIEVKYASTALRNKKLREQLIVDCDYYRQHPRCSRLICFIYDRHGDVDNPRGFESALTESRDRIDVVTLVRPVR